MLRDRLRAHDGAGTMRYSHEAFLKELGARLKRMRQERGWTLRDMVIEHRFHITHWQKFEGGKGISLASLLRVCEVFGVPVKELVADLGELPPGIGDAEPKKATGKARAKTSPSKRAGPAKESSQPAISRRTSLAPSTSQTTERVNAEPKTGTRRSTKLSRQP